MRYLILLVALVAVLLIPGCGQKNERPRKIDVSEVKMKPVEIKRYEQDIFELDRENLLAQLKQLQNKYPFFLAGDLEDTLNIIQIKDYINDSLLNELYRDVSRKYQDISELETTLSKAFKRIKYHYPAFTPPQVYTYISGLDVNNPVIYTDSVMLIALDNYLGNEYKTYRKLQLPLYKIRRMRSDYIAVDCIKEIAYTFLPEGQRKTLLDHMVDAGKTLYYTNAMLPGIPDSLNVEYTPAQMAWAQNNEASIWAHLIEKDLLFTRNSQAINKLMVDGPFTSGFSRQSPSRIGEWIGWQIIHKLMIRNKGLELPEMMQLQNSQQLLKRSNYKPEK